MRKLITAATILAIAIALGAIVSIDAGESAGCDGGSLVPLHTLPPTSNGNGCHSENGHKQTV